MEITELEKQLTELQDIEAIKQLKAEYCDICDDAHNPERIVSIFADDGIWEAEGVGYAKGPAELRQLFKSFADRISFSQHNVFNPRITVNGNEAHGTWYFLGPFTFRKGGSSGDGLLVDCCFTRSLRDERWDNPMSIERLTTGGEIR
jgi:SnoaL-like domain